MDGSSALVTDSGPEPDTDSSPGPVPDPGLELTLVHGSGFCKDFSPEPLLLSSWLLAWPVPAAVTGLGFVMDSGLGTVTDSGPAMANPL